VASLIEGAKINTSAAQRWLWRHRGGMKAWRLGEESSAAEKQCENDLENKAKHRSVTILWRKAASGG
jgi:hypothetical protein